jgi:subtilisin family serine protease
LSLYIASDEDLEALAKNAAVERFGTTPEVSTHLNESPLVGGDEAFSAGYTGAGRRIALIDTGVEATHDDLEDATPTTAASTPSIRVWARRSSRFRTTATWIRGLPPSSSIWRTPFTRYATTGC